uniref:Uncharacterized protein n=2 Tax=Eucampia antarctica TaxID=49252 RepID=A0A7S2R3F7_9STRA|mmetsp:Transcript_1598/g.1526  ORF Transcript_1598/g.1526 Transcript_1598/m.1526 type:complete len:314 (+) Transcript_1598:126-1067(+)
MTIASEDEMKLVTTKKTLLSSICAQLDELRKSGNMNRLPRNSIFKIVQSFKDKYPWINRFVIHRAFKKYSKERADKAKKKKKNYNKEQKKVPVTAAVGSGSPTSLTLKNNFHSAKNRDAYKALLNEITSIYQNELDQVRCEKKNPTARLKKKVGSEGGSRLAQIIDECKERYDMPDCVVVSPVTIRSRLRVQRNAFVTHKGPCNPMEKVEPQLVQIILQINNIHRNIISSSTSSTNNDGLRLANSLIHGKPIEKEILDWKLKKNGKKNGGYCQNGDVLGNSFWRGFLKRNSDSLVNAKNNFGMSKKNNSGDSK